MTRPVRTVPEESLPLIPRTEDALIAPGNAHFQKKAQSTTNLKGIRHDLDNVSHSHRSSSAYAANRRKLQDQDVSSSIPLSADGNIPRRCSVSVSELFKQPQHPNKPAPFLQQLFSARLPINNPLQTDLLLSPSRRGSVIDAGSSFSLDLEDALARVNIFNSLRPAKLIGNYKGLCNWYEFYNLDYRKIGNKGLRSYYKEQNCLIERFQEIDNFLDAGKVHYNMLSNYGDQGSGTLETHMEEAENSDKDSSPKQNCYDSTLMNNDASHNTQASHLRFHDIPGNVGYEGAVFLGYNKEEADSQVRFAIMVNFFINFLLLVGKIIVSILTSSISVVASLVDSILDFLSTFIIFISNKLSSQKNWKVEHSYPVGRSRLEPLGVLVFSIIIIISFFQVGQESFKRLLFTAPAERQAAKIGPDAVAIMLITILAKVGCWIWCAKSSSSSVQALAQDAMTDIVFNSVSLLMPTIGFYFDIWWFDPLGAFLLSVYIIVSWCRTAYEHIDNLTGAVADPVEYKVILYLAYRFAESIKLITNLKVYHVGDAVNVEIDIVFAAEEFNLSFKDCHDIAEALQYSIETLPFVERAFVHIDYMEGNFKGHLT